MDELRGWHVGETCQCLKQVKIGAGEEADVVCVLPVDAFKTLRNDALHTCHFFGGRTVFSGGAFAIPLARNNDLKICSFESAFGNGQAALALGPGMRVVAQFVVIVAQDGNRRDLVC